MKRNRKVGQNNYCAVLTAFVFGVGMSLAGMETTLAADISGNVHNAPNKGGLGIEDAGVNLYMRGSGNWNYVGVWDTDENGDFHLTGLSDGNYYIKIRPSGDIYILEYYNDASDSDDKTEIVISGGISVENLDIELATKWVYVKDNYVYPEFALEEGSTIEVNGIAVNDTGAPLNIYYWINIDVNFDIDFNGRSYNEYSEFTHVGPAAVTLLPGETPFKLPITVPAEWQGDERYDVNLFLGLDPSRPIFETYVDSFTKIMRVTR